MSDVKITIDTNDKELAAALNRVSKSFQDTARAGNRSSNVVKKGQDGVNSSIRQGVSASQIFAANLAANLASKAITSGFRALTSLARGFARTLLVDGVKAAQVQEDSINALNSALARTGQFTHEASQDFQDFASELQATTTVGDEVILQNAALIQSLGNLETEALKGATEAAVNMAAALQVDLRTAANLVGRAAAGDISTFTRYGVTIERGADNAETFANTLETLNRQFGGAAADELRTYSGQTQALANDFGDFTEEIGFVITQNEVLIDVIDSVRSFIRDMSESVNDANAGLTDFVSQGIILTLGAFERFIRTIDLVSRSIHTFTNAIKVASLRVGQLRAGLRGNIAGFREYGEAARLAGEAAVESLVGDTILGDLANGFQQIKASAAQTFEQVTNSADREERRRSQIRNREIEEQLENDLKTQEAELDHQIKLTEIRNEQAAVELEQRLRFQEHANELEIQTAVAGLKQRQASELAEQKIRLANLQGNQNAAILIEQKSLADAAKQNLDLRKATNAEEIRLEKEKEEQIQAVKESGVASTISLMRSSNKTLFRIGQSASIAQTIVNTYKAAQLARATLPPPFGSIAAGVEIAAGFVNVAQIKKQQPRFQHGGIVPGSSFRGDNVSARVNSGEMILNQRQQSSLFNQINRGGSGVQEIVVHTTVELDGEKVGRSVSRQVADGLELGKAV